MRSFPIDVIKTKMQSLPPPDPPSRSSASQRAAPHPYATLRSTVGAILRESGWRGFVTGLAPTLVRSVPVNMVRLAAAARTVAFDRLGRLARLPGGLGAARPGGLTLRALLTAGHFRRVRTRRRDLPLAHLSRSLLLVDN